MIEVPHSQPMPQIISSYEDATAIIFFADLSAYDQPPSLEDASTSLQDALLLFETLLNSPLPAKTQLMLFLNKADILKEKILVSPLSHYFPDYSGGEDYREAISYIMDQFISLSHNDIRQVYTHITCSVDTTQIRFVMASCSG